MVALISTNCSEPNSVKVIHGANDRCFSVGGEAVISIRTSLVDAFNIPPDAIALVNGEEVSSTYTVHAHDTLEFVGRRGEKGSGRPTFTEKDLNDLGLTVVGNEAVPIDNATPDETWELSRLESYALGHLADSANAEDLAILQSKKAAVELFGPGVLCGSFGKS